MKEVKVWRFMGGNNSMLPKFAKMLCTIKKEENGSLKVFGMNHHDWTFKTSPIVDFTELANGYRIVHTQSGSCYEFELFGVFVIGE